MLVPAFIALPTAKMRCNTSVRPLLPTRAAAASVATQQPSSTLSYLAWKDARTLAAFKYSWWRGTRAVAKMKRSAGDPKL